MRKLYKEISGRALKMAMNPLLPSDVKALIGDLVFLVGQLVDKVEKLERKYVDDGV